MRLLAVDSRLEAIAGEPDAMLTSPGSVAVTAPSAYSPITLYAVADWSGASSTYPNVAKISTSDNADRVLVLRSGTTQLAGARVDFPAGASNDTAITDDDWTTGGHAAAVSLPDGLTTVTIRTGSGATASSTVDPGDGWESGLSLLLYGSDSLHTPLAGLAYWAEHDQSTQTRVLAWLARRFSLSLSLSRSLPAPLGLAA